MFLFHNSYQPLNGQFVRAGFSHGPFKFVRPSVVTLLDDTEIPIVYEDRSVLALDKPVGWVLGPDDRDRRPHNLQAALEASLASGPFWARSRNLRYLRFVHRLDKETSGVLL